MRLRLPDARRAFTLVEVLIAIGILGLVLTAIYSSWTSILRATKVGLDAAAAVQRSRIALRTLEDSLACAQAFGQGGTYYDFLSENGEDASISFVARLPKSFPRSGKFGELDVRRVTFSVESGTDNSRQLVLRQAPILMEMDEDEQNYPLVLARNVKEMEFQFWDLRKNDWVDEWKASNQLPKLVMVKMSVLDNPNQPGSAAQEITRFVSVPSELVQPQWLSPRGGGIPTPGSPGSVPTPGQPGVPGQPGLPPGGMNMPGPGIPAPGGFRR
jgi:type II secretion system protein J